MSSQHRQPGTLRVTGLDEADALLNDDPLALLLGMLLDQQVPMEWAFRGPYTLRERLGALDVAAIVAAGPDALDEAFRAKPALHRYPSSMAKRAYELCAFIAANYSGDPQAIWVEARDAGDLFARIRALPGYGDEKAKIFLALLAKRFGVRPAGWEAFAGAFADGSPRSVADIDGPDALAQVRAWKKQQKAQKKSKQD
jgi:uncharacterized HhH-GPD family protein